MERPHGKESGLLFFEPAGFGQGLAFGAVAVSARVIGWVFKATGRTLFHVTTQGGGATILDGPHDPAVRKRQGMSAAIVFTVLTKDMAQLALGSCCHSMSDRRHDSGPQ